MRSTSCCARAGQIESRTEAAAAVLRKDYGAKRMAAFIEEAAESMNGAGCLPIATNRRRDDRPAVERARSR